MYAAAIGLHSCFVELFIEKADGGMPFIWLFTAIAAVVYLPLAVWIVLAEKPYFGLWQIVMMIGSTLAHFTFFILLQKGYKKGDLSLVYPVARGTGPFLTCILAIVLFHEKPSVWTIAGTCFIVLSVLFFTCGLKKLTSSESLIPILYGLATGVMIAGYTLLDKGAVSTWFVPPLLLDFCNTIGRLIILTPFAIKNWSDIQYEWKAHKKEAAGVGVFNSLAYILALSVMASAPVAD
ncbi:EamA family transporter [Pseudomonas sp. ISL-88]|uniref:SMR family transporter n=1 Tax=Bacteria TaxID=2 RepID=UPI001BE53E15|nr:MULTISPECIES: SMR family transporter [Bacteria]MBT2711381.1 EamA family transporter [Pseudomonas sp. ISL-88]